MFCMWYTCFDGGGRDYPCDMVVLSNVCVIVSFIIINNQPTYPAFFTTRGPQRWLDNDHWFLA